MSRKGKQLPNVKDKGKKNELTWDDLIALGRKNNQQKTSKAIKREVILKVRRGKRLYGVGQCTACRSHASVLTRYSKSSLGVVILCHPCRIAAFERSFGYADAMTLAMN
ncbi:hypothetical protein AB4383_12225 [Vibrio breoganii]